MKTERLYYDDAYMDTFPATVCSCEPDGDGYAVVLDRTAFYPEGGGQPSDIGFIDEAEVSFVKERDEEVCHYTKAPLPVGKIVTGHLNYAHRFDLMQQHSGEHMLSGLVCAMKHCDNVGFHLGSDRVTIDFNTMLSDGELAALEQTANEMIWKNIPVRVLYPSREELASIEYRSKKELSGQVRLVEYPGVDLCACCGTHVKFTGEIGLIKIVSRQKHKGGIRMEIVCGNRALRYVSRIMEENSAVSVALSAKPTETSSAVSRLLGEQKIMKERLAELEAAAITAKANALRDAGDVLIVETNMSVESVRRLANEVTETCSGLCCVLSDNGSDGVRYAMGCVGGDLRALTKELNEKFSGRGGGKPNFVQGTLRDDCDEIVKTLLAAEPKLKLA